eukprot:scaffold3556_cov190-Cylindrotheca_fusiformis.AAC.23
MKNLALLGERRRALNLPNADSGDYIVDICHGLSEDTDSPSTVVLTKNGLLSRTSENGDILWTCNLEELKSGGGWFNASFSDPELVCLSTCGAMVSVAPSTGEADLIGVFDYGLEAASWSPDGEVLLMVTSSEDDDDPTKTKSVLISMNTQFEVLAEVTIPTFIPSTNQTDRQVSVAWRPDGSLCAISTIDDEDKMRKIRIYKRETLELHAVGRAEDASGSLVRNLQNQGLAWASAGCSQALASVQRKGKKTQQIVFFESNGLRHREFTLREPATTTVTSMTWNVDSDLLALGVREESGSYKVQLWHRCNYHWYLKKELCFPNRQVVCIKFDAEKSSDFTILLNCLEWREYEVRWDPSTTAILDGNFPAFVVDGCLLNITPLDKALVPPPMSVSQCTMDFPISETMFCRSGDHSGSMLVTLSNGSFSVLQKNRTAAGLMFGCKEVSWIGQQIVDVHSLRSHVVVHEEASTIQVLAVACGENNDVGEKLIAIGISGLDTAEPFAEIGNTIDLVGKVLRMSRWADAASGCIIQMQDGSLLEYDVVDAVGSVAPSESEPLLEPCPWICAVKNVSPFHAVGEDAERYSKLVFGLSTKSRLYFHDIMLTDSASSMFLSMEHEFLSYATAGSRCQIRFLNLFDLSGFDPFMGPDQLPILEGYEPRNVERGARIVAILPSQPMAVLQMPRGNLEGIYPRALLLRYAMTKIRAGEYGDAFCMMRKHKVDLNLLADLDPWGFLDNGLKQFLYQVENIDHLNLFISNLREIDVTQARFPVPAWFSRDKENVKDRTSFDFTTKVSQICLQARSVMIEMENSKEKPEGHFLLPVLSTFAKENPPRLDEALGLIKTNALNVPSESKKNPLFGEKAQHSIRYLAFLAEYELLFETALGMYDYEVARAVARNSQMDPKVYLPLLKRLNDLPKYYGKFEIDVRLKRFELALRNLFASYINQEDTACVLTESKSAGNTFENCLTLIDEHSLHQLGLELFKDDDEKRRLIFIALGENLMRQQMFQTALSVFLAAEPPHLDGAKQAARAAGDWRCFFSLANNEDIDESPDAMEIKVEQRRQLAREVAKDLVKDVGSQASQKRTAAYTGAARILLDYGDDVFGAVDMLLKGECWQNAHRVAKLHSRQDLIKKCIDAATSYAYDAMDDFEDKSATFATTTDKYAEVLKLRKKNVFFEGPDPVNELDETGSLFSVASQYSNMSLQSSASMVSNVSSVISVKTATTFTMTGDDGINRHRSKFNKGKKKKPKRKRKERRKPGSIEELNGLVQTLRLCCASSDFASTVAETIQYLIFVKQLPLATQLFTRYRAMIFSIETSRRERVQATAKERADAQQTERMDGEQDETNYVLIELPIEREMDGLRCAELPECLVNFFAYV